MVGDTILIIGSSKESNKRCVVEQYDRIEDVIKDYGKDSDFAEAFKTIVKYRVDDVYLVNMKTITDFKDILRQIEHSEFTYICPISIMLRDSYQDSFNLLESQSYVNQLSLACYRNDSRIIMTDNHASLYEDMDAFNADYREQIANFATIRNKNRILENVIVVANNLKESKYGNIVLASSLSISEPNEYPFILEDEAIFLFDFADMLPNLVYFKNNFRTGVTVENLVNLSSDNPNKSVLVMRIISLIIKELHFEEYIGKKFRPYFLTKIKEKARKVFDSFVGYLIYGYDIDDVEYVDDKSGAVNIVIRYTLYPLFTIESYTAEMRL